jgi:hypothetical protein
MQPRTLDRSFDLAPPLPPPPRVTEPRGLAWPRIARGSIPPPALTLELRAVDPPVGWSRVVPVSVYTGLPLLRRDRGAPVGSRAATVDRAAPALAVLLAIAAAVLTAALAV